MRLQLRMPPGNECGYKVASTLQGKARKRHSIIGPEARTHGGRAVQRYTCIREAWHSSVP